MSISELVIHNQFNEARVPFATVSSHCTPFKDFVLKDKVNRKLLVFFGTLLVIEFILFKYYYPFAGFINGDSYAYIASAFYNLRADLYPIGYPKFIRFISVFTYNDTALVGIQYLLIQASVFFFIFTLYYFYDPQKWIKVLLPVFTILNPVSLYLANYVSSDSLFLALSILWFTSLVWIINRPSLSIVVFHAIVIFLAFTVRYYALFYPIIAIGALVINREGLKLKVFGLMICGILIGGFIFYTSSQFKRLSGVPQFSPFSGWQIANNALYAYRFIDSSDRKKLPTKFQAIDREVRVYFDTTRDLIKNPQETLYASTIYMWDPRSPLIIHQHKLYKDDSTRPELVNWSKVAPLYNAYGKELIKTYPKAFAQYYLWPNLLKYYVPPVEFLESYSTGVDSVPSTAKQWFWYSSNKLKMRVSDMRVNVFNYYPIISAILNVLYVALSIAFIALGGYKDKKGIWPLWILFSFFWIANLGFSVFASPIALRFQIFPLLICLSGNLLMLNSILKEEAAEDPS